MIIQILSIHSTADIVTNSSTEMFVCNTENTKEQIAEMLDVLASVVGSHGVGSIDVKNGPNDLFDVLLELDGFVCDEELYQVIRTFTGYDVILDIPKLPPIYCGYEERDANENWQTFYDRKRDERNLQWELVRKWFSDHDVMLREYVKQFVIITGESDNSIPYELFNILCSKLNAISFHLG